MNETGNRVPSLDDPRILRNVLLGNTGYRLLTWDSYRRCGTGQWKLGYALFQPPCDPPCAKDSIPLFAGEDFGCSPMHAIDSDDALRGILGFLTLRPGDTDSEYFEGYSEEQRAWAESEAEALQEWGMDPDESEDPDEARSYFRFVDIDVQR